MENLSYFCAKVIKLTTKELSKPVRFYKPDRFGAENVINDEINKPWFGVVSRLRRANNRPPAGITTVSKIINQFVDKRLLMRTIK
jgi:hypothetical protein